MNMFHLEKMVICPMFTEMFNKKAVWLYCKMKTSFLGTSFWCLKDCHYVEHSVANVSHWKWVRKKDYKVNMLSNQISSQSKMGCQFLLKKSQRELNYILHCLKVPKHRLEQFFLRCCAFSSLQVLKEHLAMLATASFSSSPHSEHWPVTEVEKFTINY